jgi:peptide subunit release factor 1 (eRF1)
MLAESMSLSQATTSLACGISRPEGSPHGFVNRERFEDRIDENHHRFLRDVVEQVVAQAKEHGWDRIVVSGPPKVRDVARELLSGENGLRVMVADRSWEDAAPHQIADQAWPLLRSVHREREEALVTTAVERALGGGTGAVGLRRVCDALNEGRVSRLLYDSELQLEGYRSAEDTVHPRVEGVVAQSDVPLHREPLFVERLIVKAITMGASVTPIEPDASQALAPYEGVAALLRW